MLSSRLYEILKIAKENVNFYKETKIICEKDINTFPIVNRSMIIKNQLDFVNSKYTKFDIKQMLCFRTSGTSSGQPLEVYWKQDDYTRSAYYIWESRKKWYNINVKDKYVCFHTHLYSWNKAFNNDKKYVFNSNYLSLYVENLSDETIGEYCMMIEKYKPVWIQFIPSVGVRFVDYMIKHNVKPFATLNFIEYNGETLTDSVRHYIDDFFNVKSANLYGSIEVNAIAYECPHHNLIPVENNVLLESDNGNVIVTSLHNTVFPLIRYDLGDRVDLQHAKCNCGGDTQLAKIWGRTTFSIQIGEVTLTEAAAAYCIDLINGHLCNIIQQYQFQWFDGQWNLVLSVLPKFKGWSDEINRETKRIMELQGIQMGRFNVKIVYEPIFSYGKKFSIFDLNSKMR